MAERHDADRGGRNGQPVQGHGTGARASARDDQLGLIFRNMRVSLKVTRDGLARRLATSPQTIDDFETGSIAAFPHIKETSRIVRGYCELVRLDPAPILWRIESHLRALAHPPVHTGRPRVNGALPAILTGPPRTQVRAEPPRAERKPVRRRRARRFLVFSAPIAVAAGLIYALQSAPAPIYRAATMLPAPVDGMARAGLDYLALLTAAERDGLRWIDISDPQSRKVDKLKVGNP